jgi:hypothetical protein
LPLTPTQKALLIRRLRFPSLAKSLRYRRTNPFNGKMFKRGLVYQTHSQIVRTSASERFAKIYITVVVWLPIITFVALHICRCELESTLTTLRTSLVLV